MREQTISILRAYNINYTTRKDIIYIKGDSTNKNIQNILQALARQCKKYTEIVRNRTNITTTSVYKFEGFEVRRVNELGYIG